MMETIGPHWDGNEVWLITAGGAMFASFSDWYASLFSGYYIIFVNQSSPVVVLAEIESAIVNRP